MTMVTVENKSTGLKVYNCGDGKQRTIKAGESRTLDLHPHVIRILMREAAKPNSTIGVDLNDDARAEVLAQQKQAKRVRSKPAVPTTSHFIRETEGGTASGKIEGGEASGNGNGNKPRAKVARVPIEK